MKSYKVNTRVYVRTWAVNSKQGMDARCRSGEGAGPGRHPPVFREPLAAFALCSRSATVKTQQRSKRALGAACRCISLLQ